MKPKNKNVVCSKCSVSFTRTSALSRHNKHFHPEMYNLRSGSIICSICKYRCLSITVLQSHIQTNHPEIKLSFEKKTFYCVEDFEKWKTKTEQRTHSLFNKQRGNRTLNDGSIHCVFNCHRSGTYVEKANRKRRMKKIGTHKIGSTCPAHMSVYIKTFYEAMTVEVKYQSTHVGHECEVMRLPLTKEEKRQIAVNLSMGVPKATLISTLRQMFPPQKRIALTGFKDLSNICRQFQIDPKVVKHNNNANVQVRMFKDEEEDSSLEVYESPIVEISSNEAGPDQVDFNFDDESSGDHSGDPLIIHTSDHDYLPSVIEESAGAFAIEQERIGVLKTLEELQRLIQPEMSIEKLKAAKKGLVEVKRQLTAVPDTEKLILFQLHDPGKWSNQHYFLIRSK